MKTNLANLLRNAAAAIDTKKDHGAYAWMLETEIPNHIEMVRSGKATLEQFAELYELTPRKP